MTARDYQVVRIVAEGTFGHLVVAWCHQRRRYFALKVLKGEYLEQPRVLARFRDEAALLEQISHPSVVRVFGLATLLGRPVLEMEWIRGCSLAQLEDCFPDGLPAGAALRICLQMASALAHCWEAPSVSGETLRVIHRDLKPSNVLVDRAGSAKLVDFGIAHAHFAGREAHTVSMVLGSRPYIAPERLDGLDDKPSGDIYSLGLMLIEMLTGVRPRPSLDPSIAEAGIKSVLQNVRTGSLPARVWPRIRRLILSMCAYDRDDRVSYSEVIHELGECIDYVPFDLKTLGTEWVEPISTAVPIRSPQRHPDYAVVGFIDSVGPSPPGGPSQAQADRALMALLRSRRWADDRQVLEDHLLRLSRFTAGPFIQALRQTNDQPWWKNVFGSTSLTPKQISMLLWALAQRPSRAVARAAQPYLSSDDASVRAAAHHLTQMKTESDLLG